MKNFLLFLICYFLVNFILAQDLIYPSFKSTSDDAYVIKKIKKNQDNLVFVIEFQPYKKLGFINISEELYLIDKSTDEKYFISDKWGVEYKPKKSWYKSDQKLVFELIFNDVSKETKFVDLVDGKNLEINEICLLFDLKLTVTTQSYEKGAIVSVYDGDNLISEKPTDDIGEAYFDNYELLSDKNYRIELKQNGKLVGKANLSTFDVLASENLYVDFKLKNTKEDDPKIISESNYPEIKSKKEKPKPNVSTEADCNEVTVYTQSMKPSFSDFLRGVKYAVIINQPPDLRGEVNAYRALESYLEGMNFESTEFAGKYYERPSNNYCDEVWVGIKYFYIPGQYFTSIEIEFYSACTGDKWSFNTQKKAYDGVYSNSKNQFHKALLAMYGFKKPNYNSSFTLRLPKKQTCWTKDKIKQDYKANGIDIIEGIYENSGSNQAKYQVALKKHKDSYSLIYLSGANNYGNWSEGEIKATLISTATPLFFKANWVMADKSEEDDYYISFERGIMTVIGSEKDKSVYIKMYPTSADGISASSNTPSSGTGFAITSNGLIVTNNHVIDGAKTIRIRGVNGDFNKSYTAKLLITDKNNDLAILKIDDYRFSSLGVVPYRIKTNTSSVGEDVFVLGYPLISSMGENVKLTNGIISSKYGFQGDVTSYQVSAPVQPGNSGGPLFDKKGELAGVINAKHTGAENASYAVKIAYLSNLIELLEYPPSLQKQNNLNGKLLPEQMKIIKNFVYIIEVN